MKLLYKRVLPLLVLVMLCTTILTCLFGCTGKDDNRFDTDLFCCMYNEDKTGVIILSLTKKGKEQEILIIPKEINGCSVIGLNGTKGKYQTNYLPDSSRVKRIYILADLKLIGEYVFRSATDLKIIYIATFQNTAIISSAFPNETTLIVDKNQEDFLSVFDYHVRKKGAEIKIANIMYFMDEGKKDIYWIDYYDLDEEIVLPPTPIYNGRMLEGWYMDNNEKLLKGRKIKQEEKIDLIAKWINN